MVSAIFAQKKEADEYYQLYNYNKAIPLYVKHIDNNPSDEEVLHKLADCYKITNRISEGIAVYKKLVTINKANADDYFELVQMLQVTQQIDEAKIYAKTYESLEPGNKSKTITESLNNYDRFMAEQDKYDIVNKTINYNYSVRSPIYYQDRIVAVVESKNNDQNKWTGGYYTDILIADANFTDFDPFAKNLMTDLDDCAPTFSPDGKTMYYTSVNPNSIKNGNIKTKNMYLLQSDYDGSKWQKSKPLPMNSDNYSTQHSTISKDGRLLVYSSNKSGGRGGFDLYYVTKQGDGWSSPIAIDNCNTYANEVFPVFNGDDLTFSTRGLPGLGGLDIFRSKWNGSSFEKPENLKAPMNSSYDDFGLITRDNFNSGYLTSSRNGDAQHDDIYSFTKKGVTPIPVKSPDNKAKGLKVVVKDKYTDIVLPYVNVSVKDKNGNIIHQGMSDENGLVIIEEIDCEEYKIQGILNEVTTTIAKVTPEDCKTDAAYIEKEVRHNDPRFTLRGIVRDATTNQPLEGVKVTLKNETNGIVKSVTTKADGKFFFQLEQKSNFTVRGEKPKWLSSETAEVTTVGLDRSTELYVDLSLKMVAPSAKAVIALKNIFYDLDKSAIKPKSETELNNLVQLMNEYPDMKIELGSHTDCRNTHDYNQKLSQRRSESAVAYLIAKGIAKNRIIAKGYGETKLINRCADGVTCSEDEHQQNRRTEFTILECESCPK
jgi:outer membrane protein OmpA-like peptidoglycan-associated protein/tetratricopeptide (TPR) repeat protein